MSTTKIALLGAIAGLTIFIGLPLGRLRRPRHASRPASTASPSASSSSSCGTSCPTPGSPPTLLSPTMTGAWRCAGVWCSRLAWPSGWRAWSTTTGSLLRGARPGHSVRSGRGAGRRSGGWPGCPGDIGCTWRPGRGDGSGRRRRRGQPVDDDRGGDRPAQLRRGPGHRQLGGQRRALARSAPRRRLRAAQRHRGVRHRGPARRWARTSLAGADSPCWGSSLVARPSSAPWSDAAW